MTWVQFDGGADVFYIILFFFAGANLHIGDAITYAPMALAFVLVRTLAKTATVYGCGLAFGRAHRQALSTGLMLVPRAGLAIGLVRTTAELMPELGAQMSALALAAVAVFETIGPPIAAFALRLSGEAGRALLTPMSVRAASADTADKVPAVADPAPSPPSPAKLA